MMKARSLANEMMNNVADCARSVLSEVVQGRILLERWRERVYKQKCLKVRAE